MKVSQITGSVREGKIVGPKDINIVVKKLNEVIHELNSLSYRVQETNRKVSRNTLKRVKESKR